MSNEILFGTFPYVAIVLAVIVYFYRFFSDRFSFSSQSSQFLESRKLFWGSVPWHYGILLILTAHLLAALFPSQWGSLLGNSTRLVVLELTGYALALFTVVGIALLIVRRFTSPRISVVTSIMDWLLLLVLFLQVLSGLYLALAYRWGSLWYLHIAVPWLWSLFYLKPQVDVIATLPWIVRFHMFNAFLIVAVFPFTRLVHVFSIPVAYFWRPFQVVIWNRKYPPNSIAWRIFRLAKNVLKTPAQ